MQKGTVFRGFKEHLITFKPTYKYVPDTAGVATYFARIIMTCMKTFLKAWLPYI